MLSLLLAALAAGPGLAQTGAPPALTAEQVLERHVEAIGGRKALEGHSSLVLKGTVGFANGMLEGTVVIYQKAPDRYYSEIVLSGLGTVKQGFDGTAGWMSDPLNGLQDLSGADLVLARRQALFNSEANWRKAWRSVEAAGVEQVGDRAAYVIKMSPGDGGGNVVAYYDASTFLLLRTETTIETQAVTLPVTTTIVEYRTFGGVKFPAVTEQQVPTGTFTMNVTEVAFNVPVDDAKFAKPKQQNRER